MGYWLLKLVVLMVIGYGLLVIEAGGEGFKFQVSSFKIQGAIINYQIQPMRYFLKTLYNILVSICS